MLYKYCIVAATSTDRRSGKSEINEVRDQSGSVCLSVSSVSIYVP